MENNPRRNYEKETELLWKNSIYGGAEVGMKNLEKYAGERKQ